MAWQALQSGHLYGAEYDPEARSLTVQFVNGAVYQVLDVPQAVADTFFQTGSPGSYWHDKLKTLYTVVKVSSGTTPAGRRSRRQW